MKKLILPLILLLAFSLRTYHLDFPSIGYHNMIENENLSIAQEMKRTGDFVHKRVYFYNAFEENPVLKDSPQPPLVPYQILLAWRLWGENIWGSRLFNVIFGLLSVLLVYFISLLLFDRAVKIALASAFFLAVMPLGVFFSRNLQPESPALFFMLLGNLFYLRFSSALKRYNLFLGGLFFSIAWLYKFNFLFGMIPPLFCFPLALMWKTQKGFLRSTAVFLIPYLLILAAILWFKGSGQMDFKYRIFESAKNLVTVFRPAYWNEHGNAILSFIKSENYTVVFSLLASLGIALAFFSRKGALNRYIIGWCAVAAIYIIVYPLEITQNSFAQMPFLGMVCIASASAASFFTEELKKALKKEVFIYLMVLITLLSLPGIYDSIQRMYGTIFQGEEVAGESLKEFTSPGERVFLLTHPQGDAIARYAQRYMGWAFKLEDFKEKEKRFNIRYVCIYPGEYINLLQNNNPDVFNYIESVYSVKEVGLDERLNKADYIILEKGKGQKIKEFFEKFSGAVQPRAIYRIFGRFVFFYAARPETPQNENKSISNK